MKNLFKLGAIALILMASIGEAYAQATTIPQHITIIRTGWDADMFGIVTDQQPYLNPAGCSYAIDGYMASSTKPGYKTHYAVALMALALNKPVGIRLVHK